MGAWVHVHDPYVESWWEFEVQNNPEEKEHTWKRFFRNQDGLENMKVLKDLPEAVRGCEAIVLAVPHQQYLNLDPDKVFKWVGNPFAVIDCFGILTDAEIKRYLELGCEVKGLGRGHILHIKKRVLRDKKK